MQICLRALVRIVASLKLTIVLLIIWVGLRVSGVFLEATHGREWVDWYIYGRAWYVGLLGLLLGNIAAATWDRRLWQRPHSGLILAPVGLVILLTGILWTAIRSTDGELLLRKGETASSMLVTRRSQLTLITRHGEDVESIELGFSPGPADWDIDEPLDFGEIDGMGVRVLRFYRYAHFQTEWVADETEIGGPAIQVAVSDAPGSQPKERWYVPVLFGPVIPGVGDITIHSVPVATLRDDFLESPPLNPESLGVLSVHYEGRVYPLPVDGNIGKKVPVGESGLAVEIVEYYANAMTKKGEFYSRGTAPKNPMLLIKTYQPGQEQSISEIAYANRPFINMASIKKQQVPAKFWYHHPAATAVSMAEFLQTPEGKLYCRVAVDGTYQPRGEVTPGNRIALSPDSQIDLLKYVPHARKETTYTPIKPGPGEKHDVEAAALLELKTAETSERFWLQRNDAQLGVRSIDMPGGRIVVTFGYERSPLGFALKLVDVQQDTTKPDSTSEPSGVSQVQFSERAQDSGVPEDSPIHEITPQRPLRVGTSAISQLDVQRLPDQVDLAVLRVTTDPGRVCNYVGGVMLGLGLLYVFYLRAFPRRLGRSRDNLKPGGFSRKTTVGLTSHVRRLRSGT